MINFETRLIILISPLVSLFSSISKIIIKQLITVYANNNNKVPKEKARSREKEVEVYIDGNKIGEIDIDETIEFKVTADKHTVFLKRKRRGVDPLIEIDMSNNRDQFIRVLNPRSAEKITFGGIFPIIIISAFMRNILKHRFNFRRFFVSVHSYLNNFRFNCSRYRCKI